jgi:hypothetical protein
MSQKANVRLDFNNVTDVHVRNELRAWVHRQRHKYFSEDETTLQCVVALHYLSWDRPTARKLLCVLHVLVLAQNRSRKSEYLRACSYSTLRNRIADLPRHLVKKARSSGKSFGPAIAETLAQFNVATPPAAPASITPEPRLPSHNELRVRGYQPEVAKLIDTYLAMWASDREGTVKRAYEAMLAEIRFCNSRGADFTAPSPRSFFVAARNLEHTEVSPSHARRATYLFPLLKPRA